MRYLDKELDIVLPPCYQWTPGAASRGQNKSQAGGEGMARFQPGQSGNPKGRPPKRLFDDRLREALASKRGDKARMLVEKLIAKAATGNVAALKLVCERVGGKPKSPEQIAAGSNEAVTLEQVRQQLAALLSQPEVRRSLQNMLGSTSSEVVQ